MKMNFKGFILLSGLLFGPATAFSAVTVYTNEAAWLAATSGSITVENFESSPLGLLASGTTNIGSFDISIANNADNAVAIANGGSVNGTREFQGFVASTSNLSIDFLNFSSSPLYAFAGEWFSTTTGNLLTMNINGTIIKFSDYLSGVGTGFLGFVDTNAFTNINFGTEGTTSFGEFFSLDDAQFAAANVPEASSLYLLAFGLLGLLGASRRKI